MARSEIQHAGRQAESFAEGAIRSPWFEILARGGYAARGVVYALIGMLAVQAAFGSGGETTGTEGAMAVIARQSTALLWVLAIGLFGYAIWRVLDGILDPEHKGSDAKGLTLRAAKVGSGITYGLLAAGSIGLATGAGGGGSGSEASWTAELMAQPFGRLLVGLIGLGVIVAGFWQIRKGWSQRFMEKMKTAEMEPEERKVATRTGQFGLMSRGVVFLVVGVLLIVAAVQQQPGEARGLEGALDALARQPFGPWLLGLIALGLVAFGAYSILEARYRRIVL
jgi:hypothetical protein